MNNKKVEWAVELERIMRGAGDIVLSYYGNKHLARTMKDKQGYATEADFASERYLIEQLQAILPDTAVFAEESGKSGDNNGLCWVIDPLDGSTNFAQGLSYFCISVALTEKNVPQVAAIFQPVSNEFFYAERGKGAFLNGKKIAVSQPTALKDCVLAIGLPYMRKKRGPIIDTMNALVSKVFAVRNFGAIALDLANVACSRLDGVFFAHLAWWDVAAGMLLIEEAGGIVTDFQGKSLTPDYRSCIAGSGLVHKEVKEQLN